MKCCDLHSGLLRQQITIERETQTKDSVGGYSSSWATHIQPFAFVKPISGLERLHAMKLETNVTHKIYIRYVSGLTTKDRVAFNSREMQIHSIINLEERDKWLELTCIEGRVN